MIKDFLINLVELIFNDVQTHEKKDVTFYTKLQKYAVEYIGKMTAYYFDKFQINEIYLNKSNIGQLGCEILALLMRYTKYLGYINLTSSQLTEDNVKILIIGMGRNHDYFTIDLKGVSLSLNALKLIKTHKTSNFKKDIIIGAHALEDLSKVTNKRKGKAKEKKKKVYGVSNI